MPEGATAGVQFALTGTFQPIIDGGGGGGGGGGNIIPLPAGVWLGFAALAGGGTHDPRSPQARVGLMLARRRARTAGSALAGGPLWQRNRGCCVIQPEEPATIIDNRAGRVSEAGSTTRDFFRQTGRKPGRQRAPLGGRDHFVRTEDLRWAWDVTRPTALTNDLRAS